MKFEPVLPNEMKKKLQLPIITFLIILQMQHYFVRTLFAHFPRGNLTDLIRNNLRGGTLSLFSL